MYCAATFFVWGAYHVGVEAFEAVSTHIWSQSVDPCCVAVKGGKGFFLCNADNAGLFSGMVIWLVWRGQWSLHGCRLSNTRIPGSAGDEDWDVCIQSGCSYTTIISEIWGSQTDWQELKTCPQLWGFSRAEHFRHISRTRSIGPYSAHAPGGATESWEFLILGGYIGYTGLYMLTLYTLYCFTVYIYIPLLEPWSFVLHCRCQVFRILDMMRQLCIAVAFFSAHFPHQSPVPPVL